MPLWMQTPPHSRLNPNEDKIVGLRWATAGRPRATRAGLAMMRATVPPLCFLFSRAPDGRMVEGVSTPAELACGLSSYPPDVLPPPPISSPTAGFPVTNCHFARVASV